MSNYKQGLSLHQFGNSFLNIAFIVCIHTCGSFVQNDDRRVFQDTACNRNTLLFAPRECRTAFANHRFEPLRQSHNEIIAAGFSGSLINFFFRSIRFSHTDIVVNGVLKQIHTLEYHADLIHQFRQRYIANIHAPYRHIARFYIPKSRQQVCNGGLTTTGWPNQCCHRIFLHGKTDMMQNLFVLISKCNIVELDFWLSWLCLSWNMLLAIVGKFWFVQYRFNAIKSSVHNGQSGCFSIESLQRAKKIKYKQQNTQHISQRKHTALFQHNRQAENCRNTNTIKDIQPHCPRGHFLFKVKRCISGTLEIAGQFFGFFSKQVIALNNTNALHKRQHRIGQPFALLLTACCFSQGNFVHPLRYQPCQNSNYRGDQAKLPIQIKHERQQKQRG